MPAAWLVRPEAGGGGRWRHSRSDFLACLGRPLGSFGCVVIDWLPLALEEANEVGERWDTRP
ncbi:MAG: hypothetical protein R2754_06965 [Microthrixaceae bacterium]